MVTPFAIRWSSRFKKDYKKMRRQGKDMTKLDSAIVKIATRQALPDSMRDHDFRTTGRIIVNVTSRPTGS